MFTKKAQLEALVFFIAEWSEIKAINCKLGETAHPSSVKPSLPEQSYLDSFPSLFTSRLGREMRLKPFITRANYIPEQCEHTQAQQVPNHHNLELHEAATIKVGIPNLECPNSQNVKIKFPAKILRIHLCSWNLAN